MVQIWWHGTSYPLYSEDIAGTVLAAPLSTSTASGLNRGLNENAQLFGCSFLFRIPILTPMRLFGICRLTGNFSQFGWADDSKYIGNKRAKWLLQLLSRFFLCLFFTWSMYVFFSFYTCTPFTMQVLYSTIDIGSAPRAGCLLGWMSILRPAGPRNVSELVPGRA